MESSNFIYTRNTLYVSSASTRSFRKLGRAKNVVLFSNINQAPVKHQCSDFCLQQQWMEYRLIREGSKVLLLLPAKACDMLDLFPSKLIIFCTKLQSWNPSSSLLTGEGMHLAKNTHTLKLLNFSKENQRMNTSISFNMTLHVEMLLCTSDTSDTDSVTEQELRSLTLHPSLDLPAWHYDVSLDYILNCWRMMTKGSSAMKFRSDTVPEKGVVRMGMRLWFCFGSLHRKQSATKLSSRTIPEFV